MKKIFPILIIFSLLLFGVVSAETQQMKEVNWFQSITHSLGLLFTSAGQSRYCSVNPDKVLENVQAGTILGWSDLGKYCSSSYPAMLLNVYDLNWAYKGEYNLYSGIAIQVNVQANRNIQIYCCPYKPCATNSDCSIIPASNYGDTCQNYVDSNGNPNGACYQSTAPTHTTKVYQCSNGFWTYVKSVNYGTEGWCATDGYNNYLNSATTGSCLNSAPTIPQSCQTQSSSSSSSGSSSSSSGSSSSSSSSSSSGGSLNHCGDSICQSTETQDSCPIDCIKGSGSTIQLKSCSDLLQDECSLRSDCKWNNGFLGIWKNCQKSTDSSFPTWVIVVPFGLIFLLLGGKKKR